MNLTISNHKEFNTFRAVAPVAFLLHGNTLSYVCKVTAAVASVLYETKHIYEIHALEAFILLLLVCRRMLAVCGTNPTQRQTSNAPENEEMDASAFKLIKRGVCGLNQLK